MRELAAEPSSEVDATWVLYRRNVCAKLFVSCWLIYALHMATNTVREIYPALAMADHLTFRVDEYAGLHPDLFETPGRGWHINGNPGASMLAAIPYTLCRPAVDAIVTRVNAQRAANPNSEPPSYQSPWPMAQAFYREAWRRGLDVKFGLAALITQTLVMGPLSALSVVTMFLLFRRRMGSEAIALRLAVLYGLGTPVFFRTGYLNQNLLVADCALFAYFLIEDGFHWASWSRYAASGICAGTTVLMDYSGVVPFVGLLGYVAWRTRSWRPFMSFLCGALPLILLLGLYQWQSFGNPFLPAQHWMPRVEYSNSGYNGLSLPQPDMLRANLFDFRYGLFVSCPLLLLSLVAPFVDGARRWLRTGERTFCLVMACGIWLFASSIGYSRLQFNTGVRYLVPAIPFLFMLASAVLLQMNRRLAYALAALSVAQAWSMAMYRDVERGYGALEPVLHAIFGGVTLPLWTVMSRMGGPTAEYFRQGSSPLFVWALISALLYILWRPCQAGTDDD